MPQNFPTVEKNNLTNFIMWTDEAVYTDYHLPVTSEQHITISACQAKKIYNCYQSKHVFNVMMPPYQQ